MHGVECCNLRGREESSCIRLEKRLMCNYNASHSVHWPTCYTTETLDCVACWQSHEVMSISFSLCVLADD